VCKAASAHAHPRAMNVAQQRQCTSEVTDASHIQTTVNATYLHIQATAKSASSTPLST
jgi:hypothetical protein